MAGSYIKEKILLFPGALDGFCPTHRDELFPSKSHYGLERDAGDDAAPRSELRIG